MRQQRAREPPERQKVVQRLQTRCTVAGTQTFCCCARKQALVVLTATRQPAHHGHKSLR